MAAKDHFEHISFLYLMCYLMLVVYSTSQDDSLTFWVFVVYYVWKGFVCSFGFILLGVQNALFVHETMGDLGYGLQGSIRNA